MEMILDGCSSLDRIDAERGGDESDIIDISREQGGDKMLSADIRERTGAGEMKSVSQDIGNCRREGRCEVIGEFFRFLAFQAELAELFFLEAHIFEQKAAEAAIFEEDGEEEMAGFYGVILGIAGDISRFFEAVSCVE